MFVCSQSCNRSCIILFFHIYIVFSYYRGFFKQQGLSQHCKIRVRFWSTKFDEVPEASLDYSSVGHETAAIKVEYMKESLSSRCVLQISRDNPNVMKSLFSKFKFEAAVAGNPKLSHA